MFDSLRSNTSSYKFEADHGKIVPGLKQSPSFACQGIYGSVSKKKTYQVV